MVQALDERKTRQKARCKMPVSTYDEQYEEWDEQTLTVLEALNKWSDEGVTVKDIVIPADTEGKE